jgi:hypothetical protein
MTDDNLIEYKELKYGFKYGAAKVTRLFSDEKKGWVTLGIETPKSVIQVYVTKTGKIRIHSTGGGEWFESK